MGECANDIITTLRVNKEAALNTDVRAARKPKQNWTAIILCSNLTNVKWLQSISLPRASHTLCGPGNIHLPVKGQFHAMLKYGQPSSNEPVYVLHNQTCSLLSRKACVELRLIKHTEKDVEEVNSGPTDFKAEIPSLFTGLGGLKTECHIILRTDAKPFCLYNPRKLPHPLLPKVKSQIETMLEQGHLSCNSSYWMVCRNCPWPQTKWQSMNLCRPDRA